MLFWGEDDREGDTQDKSNSRNLGPKPLSLKSLRVGQSRSLLPMASACFRLPSGSNLFLIYLYLRCFEKELADFLLRITSQLVPTSLFTKSKFYL